ncbi:hypothetical protein [Halomicrococcus sp. SG-WS-1]|uniref:hypothetical protein n=1 Tax=Halomicrococcus sp. SG-WS-1 TaxID=3439057 RepID=UPI003F79D2CC
MSDTTTSGASDTHDDPQDSQTTSDDDQDQPPYRDPDRLQEVYEREETIAATAIHFDISYRTARTWLIRHDIFDPDTDGITSPAQQLRELDPADVGLPPRGER